MHEVMLSVTRCSSESASVVADRPHAVATTSRAHTGARPHRGRVCAEEATVHPWPHSLPSLALALTPAATKPSAAEAIAELHRAHTPTILHHCPIHLAHSSAFISSTSLTHHCHRSSLGNATFHVAVATMVTEHRRALSSPWPALSTTPPTSFPLGHHRLRSQ